MSDAVKPAQTIENGKLKINAVTPSVKRLARAARQMRADATAKKGAA